jgi:PA14 domain-containing protein
VGFFLPAAYSGNPARNRMVYKKEDEIGVIMNNTENLQKKLRSMYVCWRNVLFTRGIAQSFGCLITCVIIACLLDMIFNLSFGLRLILMLGIYATVSVFTWFMWLKDYLESFSLERMAWLLEKTFPELNEKLISAVEFSKKTDEHISVQLIEKILEDINIDLSKIKPGRAFPLKLSYFKLPIILALLFLIALFIPQLNFPLLLDRIMLPSTADASIGSFAVLVMTPHDETCNEGDTIVFKAKVTQDDISVAELVIEGKKTSRHLMDFNKEDKIFEYKYSCGRGDFRYWVTAEECKSVTFTVKVNKRPSIDNFNISYQFPEYTKLEPLKIESTSGDIKALVNTKVKIDIKTVTKIKSAKILLGKEEQKATVTGDGRHAVFDLIVTKTEDYSIELTNTKGLTNKRKLKYHIIALEDKLPIVNLITPKNDLSVYAEDEITLKWESTDDFGVKKQMLVIVPNGNMKQKQLVALKFDKKEKKIKLADLKIKYGGDIDIFIRAEDDAGHHGDSRRITLHIGGLRFKDSQQFIAELNKIQKSLKSIKKRLHVYNELYFRFYSVNGNGANQEEKDHQKRLIDQQTQQIQIDLDTALDSAANLKHLGFFRKSSFYSELVKRYIRQEKLFSATKLTSPEAIESAIEKINEMAALNRKMAGLLKQKAYQNIADFKTPAMLKSLKNADNHKRFKFRKQAFEMASGMNFKLFKKVDKNKYLKQQSGLYRYVYTPAKGQFKNYVNPGAFPQSMALDYTIDFPDVSVLSNADSFAVTWYGELKIENPGKYSFKMIAQDGARLFVNNKKVIALDGIHKPKTGNGYVVLKKGTYPIGITYFSHKKPGKIQVWMQSSPGKMIPLSTPYIYASGYLSVNRIIALLSVKAKETVNNYTDLDKLAAEIMKKLIPDNKQLKQLALKLEAHNKKEDWDDLKKIAEEMRKTAEKEKDKEKKIDQKLIADVLIKAEKDKKAETLRELAKHLPDLEKQSNLKDIRKSIDKLKEKFKEKIENLEKAVAKKADKASLKDRVDELKKDLEKVAADIEAVNKLNKLNLDVARKIDELKNELKNIDNKVDKNQQAKIKPDTDRLEKNIALPEKSIKDEIARNKEKEEKARDNIKQLAESKVEKLDAIKDEIAKLAKTPENNNNRDELAKKKEKAQQELAKLADDLRDEATHEIEKEQADIDAAKEKVAIAAMIDKVKTEIKPDGKNKLDNSEQKLRQAADKMEKVSELLDKHEKMNKSQLAEEEARKEHEKILETAKKEDKELEKLLEEIDKTSALKEAEKNISELADKSKQMEKRANKQQAEDLASKTDHEKRNLESLDPNAKTENKPEQKWQDSDITKNLEKKPNLEHLAKVIDNMRKNVAQAEAHKKTEEALGKELQKHDVEFKKLTDNTDKKKLSDPEKKRLGDIEKAFPDSPMANKKRYAEELARTLTKKDKKVAKEFKTLSKDIAKAQPKEAKKKQHANLAKQQDQSIKAQADQMKQALRKQTAEKEMNEKLLDNLKRNATAQNYDAVKDNLNALEKNLKDELLNKKPEEKQEDINSKRADVLAALNDAIRKSGEKEQKEKLIQAKKATLDGELEKAKALTKDAIEHKKDEVKLAKNVVKANDYKKQNIDKIQLALNDLKQNKLIEAAAKLNNNPKTEKEQNMLKNAAKKVNDGIEQAMTKAMHDSKKPNRNLENAAKSALKNQLENALKQARQAGEDGKKAQQSFDEALAAKKSVEKSLNGIMKDAKANNQEAAKTMAALPEARKNAEKQLQQLKNKQKTNKSSELAKQVVAMDAKKHNLKRIEDLMTAKDFHKAAEHAKRATKGAYEADKALSALEKAINDKKELAEMKKEQIASIPSTDLLEPIKDLENANKSLNKGKVEHQATKSLENAAEKLKKMAQKSMNSVQSKLAQQNEQPSESESKGQPERQGDSAQLADGALKNTQEDWKDIDSTMSGENDKGHKTNYSSYYRKANKEYLSRINKENKNWE